VTLLLLLSKVVVVVVSHEKGTSDTFQYHDGKTFDVDNQQFRHCLGHTRTHIYSIAYFLLLREGLVVASSGMPNDR